MVERAKKKHKGKSKSQETRREKTRKTKKGKKKSVQRSDTESSSDSYSDKKKRRKKKKCRRPETESSSCNDNISNSSGSESENKPESSSDSSDSSDYERHGVKPGGLDAYSLAHNHLPADKIPAELKNRKEVEKMEISKLTSITEFIAKAEELRKKSNLETLSRDTKPKKVKFSKGSDDCEKKLHKARFLRFPIISPTKWFGKHMPKKRSDSFKALPFDFVGGSRKVSSKVIGWAHDRTHVLELKHFSSSNLGVASRPRRELRRQDEDGAATLFDLDWEVPDTLSKFREALDNFTAVYFMLWPLDSTGISMARLMNVYNYCSNAENSTKRLSILRSWFNDALRSNAERAVNEECILSYSELEAILKETLRDRKSVV